MVRLLIWYFFYLIKKINKERIIRTNLGIVLAWLNFRWKRLGNTKLATPGLCKLVGISLWHGFLCQNKMKLWMDCGNFSDFVLGSLIRFGKIAWRYLDLIHFPLPVRTICLIPDIGSIKGVERERWKGEERLGY